MFESSWFRFLLRTQIFSLCRVDQFTFLEELFSSGLNSYGIASISGVTVYNYITILKLQHFGACHAPMTLPSKVACYPLNPLEESCIHSSLYMSHVQHDFLVFFSGGATLIFEVELLKIERKSEL